MTAKEFDDILSFLDTIIRVENNIDIGDKLNKNCCKSVCCTFENGNLISWCSISRNSKLF